MLFEPICVVFSPDPIALGLRLAKCGTKNNKKFSKFRSFSKNSRCNLSTYEDWIHFVNATYRTVDLHKSGRTVRIFVSTFLQVPFPVLQDFAELSCKVVTCAMLPTSTNLSYLPGSNFLWVYSTNRFHLPDPLRRHLQK